MAEAVETAIYQLRYDTGNSARALDEVTRASDRLVTAAAKVEVSETRVTESTRRREAELRRLHGTLDPAVRANAAYERAVAKVAEAERLGAGTAEERARILDLARQRFKQQTRALDRAAVANDNLAGATRRSGASMAQLAIQAQDLGVQIASGANPFTALIQQGSQVVQSAQASGQSLGELRRDILGLVTPARVVGSALLAAFVGGALAANRYAEAQLEVSRALVGVGRGAGATASAIERISRETADGAGLSVAAVRDLAAELTRTGRIRQDLFAPIAGIRRDFAATLGLGTAEANQLLARSFADPSRGADELNERLGFLDDRTRQLIRTLQDSGRRFEAQQVLLSSLTPSLGRASDLTSIWARAWEAVSRAASNAADAVGRALTGPSTAAERYAEATRRLRQLQQEAQGRVLGNRPDGTPIVDRALDRDERARREAAVRDQQRVVDGLNTQVTLETKLAQLEAQRAAQRAESIRAGEAARGINDPREEQLRLLRTQQEMLQRAGNNMTSGPDLDRIQRAYNTVTNQIREMTDANGNLIPATERVRQQTELQVRQIRENYSPAQQRANAELQRRQELLESGMAPERAAAEARAAGIQAEERALEGLREARRERNLAADQNVTRLRQEAELAGQSAGAQARLRYVLEQRQSIEQEAARNRLPLSAYEAEIRLIERRGEAIEAETNRSIRARLAADAQFERQIVGLPEGEQQIAQRLRELYGNDIPRALASSEAAALRFNDQLRQARQLGQDIGKEISSALEGVFTGATRDAETFFKNLSQGFARIGSRQIEQQIIAPLFNGGQGGIFSQLNSLFRPANDNGTGFDIGRYMDGVQSATQGGVESAFRRLLQPQVGPDGQSLGFASSPLGGALGIGGAGLAGAGIGFSSQNPLIGAAGGALTGFAAGAALGSWGGPIGAVVGGIAGLIGGLLGKSNAKKQAEAALAKEREQAREMLVTREGDLGNLRQRLSGRGVGSLESDIRQTGDQVREYGALFAKAGQESRIWELNREYDAWVGRQVADFRRSVSGTIDALNEGFGDSGPFQRAFKEAQDLREQLTAFLDDVNRYAREQLPAATEAAQAYALTLLTGAKEMTATEQAVAKLQGTAAGLQNTLEVLGMSADQAATAIASGLNEALAKLRTDFETDLTRRTDDAMGRGYLNDVRDLVKERDALLKDAAILGTDPARVTAYFEARARDIARGADLSATALDELVKLFPDLAKVADLTATSLEDTIKRQQGYLDRVFAATNDNSTLEGQLVAFDRAAMKEREEEIRNGSGAILELEQALSAERLKLIRDFGEQQRQALEQAREAWTAFARSIREWVDSQRAGASSPLSPQARLAAAQSQYNAQLALAQGGNRDALNGITGYANDLIDAGRAFYASSSAFQSIFSTVLAQMEALPSQVSAEQFIVNAIETAADENVAALDLMRSQLATAINAGSATATASALATYFNKIDTNTSQSIDLNEMQIALGGMASNSALRDMFTRLDVDNSGSISRLEAIRGSAVATETHSATTANKTDLVAQLTQTTNSFANSANQISNTQTGLLDATKTASQQQANILMTLQFPIAENVRRTVQNTGATAIASGANPAIVSPVYTWAEGGWVQGPGTGTSDSIVGRVSNGEFVMKAAAASMYERLYPGIMDQMNAMTFRPVVTMPMVTPSLSAPFANDNAALLRQLIAENRAMREELAAFRKEITRVTAVAAEHVGGKVDEAAEKMADGERRARFLGHKAA